MSSRGWTVKLNGKVIETVSFDRDCDADYVKRSLVDNNGYSPNINVYPGK